MSKFELKTPEAPMSYRQGIMIRNLGGGDVRGENLTMQEASDRIQELNPLNKGDSKPTASKEAREIEFQSIWDLAVSAGRQAGENAMPTPMVVSGYEDQPVMDGACGFAWVQVRPGTSAFAKWLKRMDYARKDSYLGGVSIWISDYNQSMARKEAHATAMAKVFRDHGFDANSMSRID